MRCFRAVCAIAILAAAFVQPGPARADTCEGSHYEFDHGECYDKTGSTTSDMIKMYDDGDRLQQGMIDRSRSISVGGNASVSGRNFGLAPNQQDRVLSMTRSAFRLLTFKPLKDSMAVDDLTANVPAASRKHARAVMRNLLRDYRAYVASLGFPPNVLSTAYFFTMNCAYDAYDGDRYSAPALANGTWSAQTVGLAMKPRVRTLDNASLARANDDLALMGSTIMLVAHEARVHHDAKALARVRKEAYDLLVGFYRIDPRTTRLDDTYCLAGSLFVRIPCNDAKFYATGGRVGRNPLADMVGGANRAP